MKNMSLVKNEMPMQDAEVRNKNFLEVELGYTPEMAISEAQRCLDCKNKPCDNIDFSVVKNGFNFVIPKGSEMKFKQDTILQ